MPILSRFLALASILVGAAFLPCMWTPPASGQESSSSVDRHLYKAKDPSWLREVRYNFNERYTYSLTPDSTRFGSLEQYDELYPDSYWENVLSNLTNDDGSIAWSVSRDMMGMVALYDATEDPRFLRWLARYAEEAMAARDDHSGQTDEDGRSEPAWSTPRYGMGERRIYLVHSGLIIQPILEWAVRANETPGWSSKDEEKRQRLINQCRETLLFHDYQLDLSPGLGEAVYASGREEPSRRNDWQPYNRQNLLARDFYLLHQLTGDEEYLDRSRKLYTFFRDRLELTLSDAYVWEYEPIKNVPNVHVAVCEDISHASTSISAVLPACQDGFVFNLKDLHRFARTFTHYIHLGDGVFQTTVGCLPSMSPSYLGRLHAWLPLSEADPSIYDLIRQFLMRNVEKPTAEAIAYLIAYRPKSGVGIDTRAR